MRSFRSFVPPLSFLFASTLITGCGIGTSIEAGPQQGVAIRGHIFGGQQPVAGAHVYLLAANKTGYGGSGYGASTSNASISLLRAASTGAADTLGAYVTSDANGNFSITNDYTCAVGQQVYVLSRGGNSGTGSNAEIVNAAVLGDCPTGGSFLATVPFVSVNEVTTVAAAYALAGFATDATHVSSSGTAPALIGIRNAFANAGNLVSLGAGAAYKTTPAGNGTVPQMLINTLGNILAACENSADGTAPVAPSTSCQSLFTATPTSTDTFSAMINVAHNPGANIGSLCALQSSTAPFQPSLACATTALPNDFSLAIVFSDSNIGGGAGAVAIDSQGNAVISGNSSIVKLTPQGVPYVGSPFSGGGARNLAIDLQDNIWSLFPNVGNAGRLTGASATGAALPGSPYDFPATVNGGQQTTAGYGLAIDGSGAIWSGLADFLGDLYADRLVYNGALLTPTLYSVNDTGASIFANLAFDSSQNLWGMGFGNTTVRLDAGTHAVTSGFPAGVGGGFAAGVDRSGNYWESLNNTLARVGSTGTVTSFSPSSYASTFDMAIDGDNNLWLPSRNSSLLQRFSTAGASVLPGYKSATGPQYVAIDASGDIWLTVNTGSGNAVTELIGAAGPVTTPIALAVKNATVATRP